MHDAPKNFAEYGQNLEKALDDTFLRTTLDNFAVAYKANREQVFHEVDAPALIERIAAAKDYTARNLEDLYEEFKTKAQAKGVHVHRAATAHEANVLIARIAAQTATNAGKNTSATRIAKSKSMTSEETQLNSHLLAAGFAVAETDLGEFIVQLRNEGPSHMVLPAIHLSRHEIADDFAKVTGKKEEHDVQHLVKVARRALRSTFIEADIGITGANFCVAETGTFATCTNEGNARLVTTLPRVHVALAGLDKLVPTLDDAMNILQILPRNATAQLLTTYVTWFTGPSEWKGDTQDTQDAAKEMHIIFLDNGRSALARDPLFSQVFRCIRCGACANVCPVYRLVGGHRMGHIYIGAIGLILTYFFHGREKAKVLAHNCINCEACKHVCAGGIDLPRLIREIRVRLNEEEGSAPEATLLSAVMKNRTLFHSLLKFAKYAQLPSTRGGEYQRHLPAIFFAKHDYKALPAIAKDSFRDQWKTLQKQPEKPRLRIALFAGCAQDFIYPQQLKAAVAIFHAYDVAVDFPMKQSCCGLPLEMMGQRETSLAVAKQNLLAFDAAKYDAIVTLCTSCASHLKHTYMDLLGATSYGATLGESDAAIQMRCAAFVSKITDFSSFAYESLGLRAEHFERSKEKVTYHSSCHLCRGLGVTQAPRALIDSAAEYVPSKEEDVCCGFGGSYSMKFPHISKTLLEMKLENAKQTGASHLVVDCPGCVMHIGGGAQKQQDSLKVTHIAELLAQYVRK